MINTAVGAEITLPAVTFTIQPAHPDPVKLAAVAEPAFATVFPHVRQDACVGRCNVQGNPSEMIVTAVSLCVEGRWVH